MEVSDLAQPLEEVIKELLTDFNIFSILVPLNG